MAQAEKSLFADFAPKPEEHFRICFFGSVLQLIEGVARASGSFEKAAERFPFLVAYNNELAERLNGLSTVEAQARWCSSLEQWENGISGHLPLRALRVAGGLSHSELVWLLTLGVAEEDARFGLVFEGLQGPNLRRPALGFLQHCLQPPANDRDAARVLSQVARMGALSVMNPDAARPEWIFRFPNLVWDALRTGELSCDAEWVRYRPPGEALRMNELILAPATKALAAAIPASLLKGQARTVIVRGPGQNGRRTLLAAVARAIGCGTLEIAPGDPSQARNWKEAGALAVLLNAIPIVSLNPTPGEVAPLPEFQRPTLPLGVVMGSAGGFTGARASDAIVFELDLPGPSERGQLWKKCLAPDAADLQAISTKFRLSSGNVGRVARLARTRTALAGRARIEAADVLEATRALGREGLDLLARRVSTAGDLNRLCGNARTIEELQNLARRCRHRETIPAALAQAPGGRLNCGVRALFSGPTGTGKTLAARLLAGTLQKDLYRLDLSTVVNKYLGETEKNLSRLFDSAEQLDVMILLDEGDALMTRRTDVHSSNDRYANLETNFLLQRLETFQGILIVTTNARERIDGAFERRMDVLVDFMAPAAEERWELWQSHLPPNSLIDQQRLAQVAAECELTGSQIQNAVLHATLLALDDGGIVTSEYVEAAIRREYRKRGGICPLRP